LQTVTESATIPARNDDWPTLQFFCTEDSMTPPESIGSQDDKSRRTTLLIVFVVVFIDLLGFGIVLPLLPRYGLHFRASLATLGLLMASFSAMQFFFAPMWGSLSDRIGRRPVLLVGLLGSTLSYLLFGYVTGFARDELLLGMGAVPWLFITRIGAGIAGATISTAQAVIADCTAAEGRGKGMALIGAAFGIGFTFGPLIGAVNTSNTPSLALTDDQLAIIAEWQDTSEPLTAETVVAELGEFTERDRAALDRYFTTPRTRVEIRADLREGPSQRPGYIAGGLSFLAFLFALARLPESRPADRDATRPRRGLQLGSWGRHLRSPLFSTILISIFITTFAFAQFESTLSLLTREFGYGDTSNFVFFAYIGFVLMIGQGFLVRRLLPRLGEYRMAMIGVLLMVVGFLAIGVTSSGYLPGSLLWSILPVITIGFSAVTPSLQSLLSRAASSDEQGAVLGTGQSLSSLARILGPYMGVQLLGVSTSTPYYLAAGLMVLGVVQISRMKSSLPVSVTEE
jgi:DHA1 family tetracycline resistance protein-like MFS transporter